MGYGYHLLRVRQYEKANEEFQECLQLRPYGECRLFVGLARAAQYMKRYKLTEKWFQEAIENERRLSDFYDKAHIHYALFLFDQSRLEEAVFQWKLCIDHDACNSLHHYQLSQVHRKMGNLNEYQFHLNKALEIDPYQSRARYDYYGFYNNQYIEDASDDEWQTNSSIYQ